MGAQEGGQGVDAPGTARVPVRVQAERETPGDDGRIKVGRCACVLRYPVVSLGCVILPLTAAAGEFTQHSLNLLANALSY